MRCNSRIADRRAERIAHHFTIQAGRRCYRAERSPPNAANNILRFVPNLFAGDRRTRTGRQDAAPVPRSCSRRSGPEPEGAPPETGCPSLDRLLEIALQVRRAGDKPGVRGRGGPSLAELRFLGVVGTKLRAKVLSRGRAPKFDVAVAGTERLSAEHAATRAGVDDIPAAREHRNLPAD